MVVTVAPIAGAAVASFLLSGAWYAAFSNRLAALSPAYAESERSGLTTAVVELVRSGIVAVVMAGLVDAADAATVPLALFLAFALWLGFPAVLLAGSVFHEKVPAQLAAIHAGDWLVKLLAMAAIVGAFQ